MSSIWTAPSDRDVDPWSYEPEEEEPEPDQPDVDVLLRRVAELEGALNRIADICRADLRGRCMDAARVGYVGGIASAKFASGTVDEDLLRIRKVAGDDMVATTDAAD